MKAKWVIESENNKNSYLMEEIEARPLSGVSYYLPIPSEKFQLYYQKNLKADTSTIGSLIF